MFGNIIKSADGRESISKLAMIIGVLTSTGIVIWYAYKGTLTEDLFFWYTAMTFGTNSVNKAISVFGAKRAVPNVGELADKVSDMLAHEEPVHTQVEDEVHVDLNEESGPRPYSGD